MIDEEWYNDVVRYLARVAVECAPCVPMAYVRTVIGFHATVDDSGLHEYQDRLIQDCVIAPIGNNEFCRILARKDTDTRRKNIRP